MNKLITFVNDILSPSLMFRGKRNVIILLQVDYDDRLFLTIIKQKIKNNDDFIKVVLNQNILEKLHSKYVRIHGSVH